MASLHTIFQDIALITEERSDNEELRSKLETHVFDWEKIVPVASSHLIIPLIYCKLKEKGMLQLLPEDLRSYLTEITSQNRDRNTTLLKEVKEISAFFNKNKIDHVFLKGAALLASGIYNDIAERMVGDIDLIVHPQHLFDAQALMLKEGYTETEITFGPNFFDTKHLARLIPENKLAAVEIHRKLLSKSVKDCLQPISILENKQKIKGIVIPCYKDLLIHSILNFEINDYGYYYNYLGLRNTYDVLMLLKKLNEEELRTAISNKYMSSFLNKNSIYFNIPNIKVSISYSMFRKKLFLFKQRHKFVAVATYRFLDIIKFFTKLSKHGFIFLTNNKYRKAAINDRKRIIKLIKNKF